MGQVKDQIIKTDEKREIAIKFAIEKGLLKKCSAHGHIYSTMEDYVNPVYKYANYLFTKSGPEVDIFDSKEELTDIIKAVIDEHWFECVVCEKTEKE